VIAPNRGFGRDALSTIEEQSITGSGRRQLKKNALPIGAWITPILPISDFQVIGGTVNAAAAP